MSLTRSLARQAPWGRRAWSNASVTVLWQDFGWIRTGGPTAVETPFVPTDLHHAPWPNCNVWTSNWNADSGLAAAIAEADFDGVQDEGWIRAVVPCNATRRVCRVRD